ncbi:MAG: 4Fe-4S binding protein [Cyanobium sp.]
MDPASAPSPSSAADDLRRLAPYLLGRVRRGIVGSSRYAQKLREAIREASSDPQAAPVWISGEPGLEKDNIAALIHYGSAARRQLLVRLNGAVLRADGAELFAPGADGRALIEVVGSGGLLIDQVDRLDPALLPRLEGLARTGRWQGADGRERAFPGRLFFTSESALPGFEGLARPIRVPPLRVRRQDLGEWLRYGVRQKARSLGWSPPPQVSPALIKRLQSADFPGNLRELSQLIDRALRQCAVSRPAELPEDVFWIAPRPQVRARFEFWRWKPQLRDLMRSPRLWNTLLFGLVSWLFVLVNLWLWLGPQDRAHNGALNLFWAWWWPLILITFPLVGRLWCSFCPFMVWGEIAQRLARVLGWQPARWPRGDSDRWGAPLLAAGFAAILLWEKVWDLQNTAWLSSCLLLLITAGAVIGSLRYEKRFWCRYLCPVGGMNGLFAKLAVSELRAQIGTCSGSCSSFACFKGGPAEGEGFATAGCPVGTHPAHLADNRNCVLCLTCAQACPHRSITLRLRPPAADLQRTMDPPAGEAGLILVLAGGICAHHSEALLGWLPDLLARLSSAGGVLPSAGSPQELLPRLAQSSLALALPAGLWLLLRGAWLGPRPPHPRPWLLLYALLPLLWATLLADHLRLGMAEAGQLLPVALSPLRPLEGFGIAEALAAFTLPGWSADEHVIRFCQSLTVALGLGGSLVLLRRLLLPDLKAWLGQGVVLAGLALAARALVGLG